MTLGGISMTYGHAPHDRFFGWTQTTELHGDFPPKQQICKKNKKEITRRNRTNDHQTATADNHGQWNDGLNRFTK